MTQLTQLRTEFSLNSVSDSEEQKIVVCCKDHTEVLYLMLLLPKLVGTS